MYGGVGSVVVVSGGGLLTHAASLELRAEMRQLRLQELQWRYINARVAHAMHVRQVKVRRYVVESEGRGVRCRGMSVCAQRLAGWAGVEGDVGVLILFDTISDKLCKGATAECLLTNAMHS
jgi:hypothetical protein